MYQRFLEFAYFPSFLKTLHCIQRKIILNRKDISLHFLKNLFHLKQDSQAIKAYFFWRIYV
ncbi:hypothetical protein HAV19_03315 [Chlamydia psittaci]|nr:hypothetical protein B600_0297 [Chlamydia psittaci VS225]AFS27803.1 hypothetical protein B712_0282 [Chlamydia psittaci NJ1]ASD31086.1 hypothetical protein CEF07_01350 [Chlamydia abortus]AUH46252.1 hypothetical protein CX655_01350 [Chlamydia psittaci]AZU11107.1 hypothetical protein D3X08_01345 [Chlamydia psittaci]